MANNPPNTSNYAADMDKLLDLNRKHEHWINHYGSYDDFGPPVVHCEVPSH